MVKSCKLSEEMIVQILSTMPPKSLIRFKCVHKLWLAIINSASFMAKNLSTSVHNKFTSSTCFLFKRTILKDKNIKDEEIYHVLSDDDNNKKQVLLSLLNLCNNNDGDGSYLGSVVEDYNVPLRMGLPYIPRIVGHCDGIVCLNTYFDDIALCNPAIKELKFLPMSCLTSPQDQDGLPYFSSWGFGYDSKAKDYKVVRVAQGSYQDPSTSRVEVYTLGANSWREVKVDIKSIVYSTPSHLYFKGTYYWMTYMPQNDDKEVILLFDMGDELFRHISVPDGLYWQDGFNKSLFVWKESIVLLSYELYKSDENPKTFEIWVLNDFVDDLWTKHVTIGPLDDIELPLVFWTSDELLMAAANGYVLSYNLCTHTFKYIPIHGVEGATSIQAFVYVNSIISVKER